VKFSNDIISVREVGVTGQHNVSTEVAGAQQLGTATMLSGQEGDVGGGLFCPQDGVTVTLAGMTGSPAAVPQE
jgi:hypothetical protein